MLVHPPIGAVAKLKVTAPATPKNDRIRKNTGALPFSMNSSISPRSTNHLHPRWLEPIGMRKSLSVAKTTIYRHLKPAHECAPLCLTPFSRSIPTYLRYHLLAGTDTSMLSPGVVTTRVLLGSSAAAAGKEYPAMRTLSTPTRHVNLMQRLLRK
jgi:hypothetical protein